MRYLMAAVLVGLLCGVASAALDTSNAYFDGTTTWAGSTFMQTIDPEDDENILEATVEWCVDWMPGSVYGVNSFIYKYQLTAGGTAPMSSFSVGMLESNEATNQGWNYLAPTTDIAPTGYDIGGTIPSSANWTFGSGVFATELTAQLTYTSVNTPHLMSGSIVDGGLNASGQVPSPTDLIPEPMTLTLLGIGAATLLRRRR